VNIVAVFEVVSPGLDGLEHGGAVADAY